MNADATRPRLPSLIRRKAFPSSHTPAKQDRRRLHPLLFHQSGNRLFHSDRKCAIKIGFFRHCPHRLVRPRTRPFRGRNAGSNPAGDANSIKDLLASPIAELAVGVQIVTTPLQRNAAWLGGDAPFSIHCHPYPCPSPCSHRIFCRLQTRRALSEHSRRDA